MRSQHSRGARSAGHPNGADRTLRAGRRRLAGPLVVVAILVATGTATPRVLADNGVDQAKQQIERLAAQLNAMQTRLEQLDQLHAAALDRMDALDAQIAQQESDLAAQQSTLDQLTAQLSSIAVDRFAGAGGTGDNPLFSTATAFTEDLQRGELTRVAYDQGAGTTDDLTKALADLQHARTVLEQFKAQQTALAANLQQQLDDGAQLEAQIKQQQQVAQQQYGDAVAAEQERQAEAAAAKAKAKAEQEHQAQIAAAVAAANAAGKHTIDLTSLKPRGSGGATKSGGATTSPSAGSTTSGGNSGSVTGSSSGNGSSNGSGNGSSGNGGSGNGSSNGNGGGSQGSANASSGADSSVASTPAAASVPPPSSRAEIAVNAARSQLGVPYLFAAESPGVAFDCSGLTKWVWGQAGVSLPHQSAQQYNSLPHVPLEQIQPGDLLFYGSPIHHVAIYIGNGQMIDAPATGKTVRIAAANFATIVGAARPG